MSKKTYVITGATSGIGNTLVKEFCKNNTVFAGYRNEKYVDELEKLGAIPFYIDMEKKDSIAKAAAFIKSQTETIDTIINVAGCVVAGVMEKLDVNEIRKQFEINTFSHLDFTQRLLPLLVNGKIINISSMASYGIFPFVGPYCASKRALDILFNSVQLNKKSIENCKNHEKEMQYMVANAEKNEKNGLDVHKVTDLIVKIDSLDNPKSSYTVGNDAKFAQFVSKFPQDWINKLVKCGIKAKVSSVK